MADKIDVRPNDGRQLKKPTDTLDNRPPSKLKKPELKGGIVKPKESIGTKLKDTFLNGRNLKDVGVAVVSNIIVPRIIDGIADASKAAIDGLFYGETRVRSTRYDTGNRTNYSSLSRPGSGSTRGGVADRGGRIQDRNGTNYGGSMRRFVNIPIQTRYDAECILEYMRERIEEAECVSVLEYYDIFESEDVLQYRKFTDNKWGWFNLDNIGIRHIPNGWVIDLPEPISLG